MKTITISIADDGAISSNFNGPRLYEAIGALQMTMDLLRETAKRQNTMYTSENNGPADDTIPKINNN